jgi:glycosyltransferase involved in cell wall biosynthesis
VIANGRNIAETFRQNRLLQGVTAGRMWDRAKNLRLLLERTLPLPLVIAGECHDGVRDSTDGVLCIGPQTQTQLFDLFEQSAVYLCTSLYEPFGLAPLEAALCGCAVLAMDLPSLREVWGSAALYFHDADSLSHLLIRLRDNPELLAQAQARSVARATTYTTSRMADQYLELLLTLTTNQHEVNAHAA